MMRRRRRRPSEAVRQLAEQVDIKAFDAENLASRDRALARLSRVKSAEAVEALMEAAKEEFLRGMDPHAYRALLESRAKEKLPFLRQALIGHQSATVRNLAAGMLGRLKDRQALPLLEKAIENDASWPVKRTAVMALGNFKPKLVQSRLKAMLTHPLRDVRKPAGIVLAGQIGLPKLAKMVSEFDFARIPLSHFQTRPHMYRRSDMPKEVKREIARKRKQARPKFHRGRPVYFLALKSAKWDAVQYFGSTIINTYWVKRLGKDLEQQYYEHGYWRATAEHEMGEFVNHQVGLAMELLYMHKHGQLKEYLEFWQKAGPQVSYPERRALIEKHFPRLKSFLPEEVMA